MPRTHRMSGKPEYQIWKNMKTRCLNPNCKSYPFYGGRGITICDQWIDSFETFFADVGERPTPLHTLDRKDNSKGYSPGNTAWNTRKQQANNYRKNHIVTFRGKNYTISQLAEELAVNYWTLKQRISKGFPEKLWGHKGRLYWGSRHS